MAKPLRSQLNQIRAWVQQGRTDAWIAHQLDVSAAELQEFRRRHELSADEPATDEVDLRDEIEAEIQAAMDAEPDEEEEEDEEADEERDEEEDSDAADASEKAGDDSEEQDEKPKRRRRRRGGRGRGRGKGALQATLQHGEPDGYGLWLDPAVADNAVYAEHWAGQREVEVDVQPDQIVIKRAG